MSNRNRTRRAREAGAVASTGGQAHVISTPRELRALRTPLRMEILGAFDSSEGLSVAELGSQLGRSPQSLYYHVKALRKAGLLTLQESRATGKRPAAIYRRSADCVLIDQTKRTKPFLESMGEMYGAAMRLAERELQNGLRADQKRPAHQDRRTGVLLFRAKLSEQGFSELRRRLLELNQFMQEHHDESGEDTALTIAFRPPAGS